jgi:hypothetical protein
MRIIQGSTIFGRYSSWEFSCEQECLSLLLVEICANFFSFSGRARTSTLSAFSFHSHESFRVSE